MMKLLRCQPSISSCPGPGDPWRWADLWSSSISFVLMNRVKIVMKLKVDVYFVVMIFSVLTISLICVWSVTRLDEILIKFKSAEINERNYNVLFETYKSTLKSTLVISVIAFLAIIYACFIKRKYLPNKADAPETRA